MKYDVHLYVVGRIKVCNVEAESQAAAYRKVNEETDIASFFPRNDDAEVAVQYCEETLGALVDEVGDEDYVNSGHWPDPETVRGHLPRTLYVIFNNDAPLQVATTREQADDRVAALKAAPRPVSEQWGRDYFHWHQVPVAGL